MTNLCLLNENRIIKSKAIIPRIILFMTHSNKNDTIHRIAKVSDNILFGE